MKNQVSALFLGMVFFLTSVTSFGQTDSINVVTSAVPFLRISPDARAGSMGDLGIATSPDANAQFYNSAKYPFSNTSSGIAVTYTPWLKDLGLNDVYLASLAGFYRLNESESISGSLRYFNLGNIEFTDNLGNSIGSGLPREFGIDGGYSRKLSDELGLGVSLRYIYSNLAGNQVLNGNSYKAGSAVAGDLSLYYDGTSEEGDGISAGFTLSNLGSKIGYTSDAKQKTFIPANLGVGVTYTKVTNEVNKLVFGLDLHKLLVPTPPPYKDQAATEEYLKKGVVSSWFSSFGDAPGGGAEELREVYFSLGSEYTYYDQFSVRAGYFYEHKTKGNRQFFSVGMGFKTSGLTMNFSYLIPSGSGVNRNPLSNTIRFSLLFDLNGSAQ